MFYSVSIYDGNRVAGLPPVIYVTNPQNLLEALGQPGQKEFTFEFPKFELPSFEFPKFEFPKFELPSFSFPFELPRFDLPTFQLPKFELPKFELPQIDLPGPIKDFVNFMQSSFIQFSNGIGINFV